ncbi:MAG: hypothetical protein HUJ86_04995 [Synergistes sp.]|nr:hypothetical protein [Synergistes sp.]
MGEGYREDGKEIISALLLKRRRGIINTHFGGFICVRNMVEYLDKRGERGENNESFQSRKKLGRNK